MMKLNTVCARRAGGATARRRRAARVWLVPVSYAAPTDTACRRPHCWAATCWYHCGLLPQLLGIRTRSTTFGCRSSQMAAPAWWAGTETPRERLLAPYSISTGIAPGGAAEIDGYVHSIRTQGVSCAGICFRGHFVAIAVRSRYCRLLPCVAVLLHRARDPRG